MTFTTFCVFREQQFSFGVEEESGVPFVSFPVEASFVSYEEFYKVSAETLAAYRRGADPLPFVDECRLQRHDDLLFTAPGRNRGTTVTSTGQFAPSGRTA